MKMTNMTLEDIIEVVNRLIEERRPKEVVNKQHLVLHRGIELNPTFKAYKTYYFTLWAVGREERYPVLYLKHQSRIVANIEEEVIQDLEKLFLSSLLNLLISEKSAKSDKSILEELVYGEFTGY